MAGARRSRPGPFEGAGQLAVGRGWGAQIAGGWAGGRMSEGLRLTQPPSARAPAYIHIQVVCTAPAAQAWRSQGGEHRGRVRAHSSASGGLVEKGGHSSWRTHASSSSRLGGRRCSSGMLLKGGSKSRGGLLGQGMGASPTPTQPSASGGAASRSSEPAARGLMACPWTRGGACGCWGCW